MHNETDDRGRAFHDGPRGRRAAGDAWGEPETKRYWGILRRRIWVVIAAFVVVATIDGVTITVAVQVVNAPLP